MPFSSSSLESLDDSRQQVGASDQHSSVVTSSDVPQQPNLAGMPAEIVDNIIEFLDEYDQVIALSQVNRDLQHILRYSAMLYLKSLVPATMLPFVMMAHFAAYDDTPVLGPVGISEQFLKAKEVLNGSWEVQTNTETARRIYIGFRKMTDLYWVCGCLSFVQIHGKLPEDFVMFLGNRWKSQRHERWEINKAEKTLAIQRTYAFQTVLAVVCRLLATPGARLRAAERSAIWQGYQSLVNDEHFVFSFLGDQSNVEVVDQHVRKSSPRVRKMFAKQYPCQLHPQFGRVTVTKMLMKRVWFYLERNPDNVSSVWETLGRLAQLCFLGY